MGDNARVRELEAENASLRAQLEEARKELADVKKQNRELQVNPMKRSYVDAEDERESNQWKEKANNLLALLDQLQRDMQNDLHELESETFSPSSSRFSHNQSSRYDSPYKAAAPAGGSTDSPFTANVTPISKTDAPAGNNSSRAAASSGGPGLAEGYDALYTSHKTVHDYYRAIKKMSERGDNESFTAAFERVQAATKATARAARKVSGTGGSIATDEDKEYHRALVQNGEVLVAAIRDLDSNPYDASLARGLGSAATALEGSLKALNSAVTAGKSNDKLGAAAGSFASTFTDAIVAVWESFGSPEIEKE